MLSTEPYIKLGWWIIPCQKDLIRLPDGKKNFRGLFIKGDRTKYSQQRNQTPTRAGQALTGAKYGVVALDCDDVSSTQYFETLLEGLNVPVINSIGKKDAEGNDIKVKTWLFKADPSFDTSFQHKNLMHFDFLAANQGFMLPTIGNKAKAPLIVVPALDKLPAIPKTVLKALTTFAEKSKQKTKPKAQNSGVQRRFLIDEVLNKTKDSKELYRILTPTSYKNTARYLDEGFTAPSDIDKGERSTYLSKISAMLGFDVSVDADTYIKTMEFINDTICEPLDSTSLYDTIITPMVEGKVSIGGRVAWRYNENWKTQTITLLDKNGSTQQVYYLEHEKATIILNMSKQRSTIIEADSKVVEHLTKINANQVQYKKDILSQSGLAYREFNPLIPFGVTTNDENVNLINEFKPTHYLDIMREQPDLPSSYTMPDLILKFLKHLAPVDGSRDYLLKFLRKKFTTFKYSCICLSFIGNTGSGKGVFIEHILEPIVGEGGVESASASEFLDKYNGFFINTFFLHMDEYSKAVKTSAERQQVYSKLKLYTGKKTVTVRVMRQDPRPIPNYTTPILTDNGLPYREDVNDRRIETIVTPYILAEADFFKDLGYEKFKVAIKSELENFMYYLLYFVDDISDDEYNALSPYAKDNDYARQSQIPSVFISGCLKSRNYKALFEYLEENEVETDFLLPAGSLKNEYIVPTDILATHRSISGYDIALTTLNKQLREIGIKKIRTTVGGKNVGVIQTPGIKDFLESKG